MVVVCKRLLVEDLDKYNKIIFHKNSSTIYSITKYKNTFFVSIDDNKVYQGNKEDVFRYCTSTNLTFKKNIKDYRR